jgi:hypothetical protein
MNRYGNFDQKVAMPSAQKTQQRAWLKYTLGCLSNGQCEWDYTNTLFVSLNNTTSLVTNQVAKLTAAGTLYNNIVGRMLTVNSTATYGNLTFPYTTIVTNGTDTTLTGGVNNSQPLPAFITGTAVSFSNTTNTALTAGTTYYVYNYDPLGDPRGVSYGTCKLALTYADAINGVAITGTIGTASLGTCSVAPVAANNTEGVIVYGIPSYTFIPQSLSTIVTTQTGLTSSTSFITAGTPVSLSNVGSLTGVTQGQTYYLYQSLSNTYYSYFRLASTFSNALAATPLSGASGFMTVNATGTATSNSVTMFSTISDTYTSGGTLDAVRASGNGGNGIGIYFDKNDDLGINGTTGFPINVPILFFTRGTGTGANGEGIYSLFSDNSITDKVTIASNSTNINIAENIYGQNNVAINILASGSIDSAIINPTRTINIGTGWAHSMTTYSTTNINIGNAQAPSSRMLTVTNISLIGRILKGPGGGQIFYTTPATLWSTAGGSFDIAPNTIRDQYTAAGSTVTLRSAVSFRAPTFTSLNSITIPDATNVYIEGVTATANNSWALYVTNNTRLNVLRVDSNVGFYGTTPVARASAYTQTYSATSTPNTAKTHSAKTAAALTNSTGGTVSTTLAAITAPASNVTTSLTADMTAVKNALASLADQVNKLRNDDLVVANLVNSIIDDLQAYGLFQ